MRRTDMACAAVPCTSSFPSASAPCLINASVTSSPRTLTSHAEDIWSVSEAGRDALTCVNHVQWHHHHLLQHISILPRRLSYSSGCNSETVTSRRVVALPLPCIALEGPPMSLEECHGGLMHTRCHRSCYVRGCFLSSVATVR